MLQIACNLTLLLGIEKTAARSRVDGITATTTSIMAENSPSAAATQTASHFQFAQLIESRSVFPAPTASPETACKALTAGFIASTMDERFIRNNLQHAQPRSLRAGSA
ncbi:hypothetical protein D3C75_1030370 [compost metagenome]